MKDFLSKWAPAIIAVAAMTVMVPRLAAAFVVVEPGFMGLDTAWLTGPGYGILAVATAAYSLQVYQDRKAMKLARWILAGWGVILLLASMILLPGMVVMVRRSELATVLPFPLDVLWCALLAMSPEIVVGIAALAFALSKDKGSKPARSAEQAAKEGDKGLQYKRLSCPRCGATSGKDGKPWMKLQQVSAHQRWCKVE